MSVWYERIIIFKKGIRRKDLICQLVSVDKLNGLIITIRNQVLKLWYKLLRTELCVERGVIRERKVEKGVFTDILSAPFPIPFHWTTWELPLRPMKARSHKYPEALRKRSRGSRKWEFSGLLQLSLGVGRRRRGTLRTFTHFLHALLPPLMWFSPPHPPLPTLYSRHLLVIP